MSSLPQSKVEAAAVPVVQRRWFERLLEIAPGAVTWLFLLSPVLLSIVHPVAVAYFIIGFDLVWLIKSLRLSFYLVRGYAKLHRNEQINWRERLDQLEDLELAVRRTEQALKRFVSDHPAALRRWQWGRRARQRRRHYLDLFEHLTHLRLLAARQQTVIKPSQLYNVVILATYNESIDIIEPSIKSLLEVDYPLKQLMLIIAYEQRGGAEVARNAQELIQRYGQRFAYAEAIEHPDKLPGEVRGKGGNITFAGRRLTRYVTEQKIDPEKVIVTTFDADHRPSRNYFALLSYLYATNVNRVRKSYQPVPMFYNNIWDVPAPMRLIATGSSFWMIMESMRPKRLRNFAAHAQSLQALIDTDYWSVTSIVEDGHQFWRTYFTYDGDHEAVPLFTPVYQDAVLAQGYLRTFRVQYLQLRRWAWGISDFPYVVKNALLNRRIGWGNKLVQIARLFEGHFSWATAPLILTFVAWLPLYLNPEFAQEAVLAHQLPIIASYIMRLSLVGILVTVLISLISLPPKPARYRGTRRAAMVLQWVLVPLTAIVFSAFAAIDAQTRLALARYLDFRVTEKATKK
ncbi:hypothetical protein KY386_02335 [Candidatus Parcubacteria bacterium]|nr:hypothetical protein [Candidatus Parcubacteria bacterium]